ncbi:hypothetical protein D3C87_504850 [compost metagenome]
MHSLNKLKRQFALKQQETGNQLRFGQFFCNCYIKESWPELYHSNAEIAEKLIAEWLVNHQYLDELPPKLQGVS